MTRIIIIIVVVVVVVVVVTVAAAMTILMMMTTMTMTTFNIQQLNLTTYKTEPEICHQRTHLIQFGIFLANKSFSQHDTTKSSMILVCNSILYFYSKKLYNLIHVP
jgi:asparagine N-glycosylation enzyme membrane subunit Stt3